jgi:predicted GNAT family N-acyltransferase
VKDATENNAMDLKNIKFDQFTAQELYLVLRARSAVFVVEQSHIHLDLDGKDQRAVHVFAIERTETSQEVAAYARLFEDDGEERSVVIDKVFTSPARRGDGTGTLLLRFIQALLSERWPGRRVHVSAPLALRAFYENFGFRKFEGPYLDHGTAYIGMTWRVRQAGAGAREAVPVPRRPRWAGRNDSLDAH